MLKQNVFSRVKHTFVQLIILYSILVLLASLFGDRGFFNGDGFSILAGSVNLARAKQGDFFLYKYHLQPMTYELNHWCHQLCNNIMLLYRLPAFLGAAGVCFLIAALCWAFESTLNVIWSFCILLLFPEIFFGLLYPNSSIFGMTFFCLALLLYFWKKPKTTSNTWEDTTYVLIGIVSITACLFRIDFLLGLPIFGFLLTSHPRRWRAFSLYMLGSLSTLNLGFLTGVFDPVQILKILDFHLHLVQRPSFWTPMQSLNVLFSITHPLVWCISIIYIFWKLWTALKNKNWTFFTIALPVFALLYPTTVLTSPNYILPAICLMPFVLIKALIDFSDSPISKKIHIHFRTVLYATIAFSIFLQFYTLEISFKAPHNFHLNIGKDPTFIRTHDGLRALGAYLKTYNQVVNAHRFPSAAKSLTIAHRITGLIKNSTSNFMIISAKADPQRRNNVLWPLNAFAIPFSLQMQGYKIEFEQNGIILIGNKNEVMLRELDVAEYQAFDEEKISTHITCIKIPYISYNANDKGARKKAFYDRLLSLQQS